MEDDTILPKNIVEYLPKIDWKSKIYFNIKKGIAKGYEVTITGKPFKIKAHNIITSNVKKCCLIDNKIYWGTDGDLPEEEIDRFEVKLNDSLIEIPSSEYNDLFNPLMFGGPVHHSVIVADKNSDYTFIILNGSDGAASYTACFIFKNGKYYGRVVEQMC